MCSYPVSLKKYIYYFCTKVKCYFTRKKEYPQFSFKCSWSSHTHTHTHARAHTHARTHTQRAGGVTHCPPPLPSYAEHMELWRPPAADPERRVVPGYRRYSSIRGHTPAEGRGGHQPLFIHMCFHSGASITWSGPQSPGPEDNFRPALNQLQTNFRTTWNQLETNFRPTSHFRTTLNQLQTNFTQLQNSFKPTSDQLHTTSEQL